MAVTPRFYTPQNEFFNNPMQKKLAEKKFVTVRIKNSRCLHRRQIFSRIENSKGKTGWQRVSRKIGQKKKITIFILTMEQSDVIWALKPDSYIIVIYPAKGFFKFPVEKKVRKKKNCHGLFLLVKICGTMANLSWYRKRR